MTDEIRILPKSRLIKVVAEFDFVLPETASTDEIEEWVRFEIGIEPSMDRNNPLENDGLDIALRGEVYLTDTGKHVKPVVSTTDEPGTYTVTRYLSEEPYVGPNEHEQMLAIHNARKDKA